MQKLFYKFDKQHINIHNNIYTYNILKDEKKSFCLCLFGSMLFNVWLYFLYAVRCFIYISFCGEKLLHLLKQRDEGSHDFLTCFYIELASIKLVLSSVHQNNYKTKDRLTNSLIVFWQFSFTYIFGSRESFFKIVRSRELESLWKSPTPRPCTWVF